MCDPTGLAVASFAAQTFGSLQQHAYAEEQAALQNQAYEQNKTNALADMRANYSQLTTRQLQEQEAASSEIETRKRQEERERSSAIVGAGESGISGLSVEGILRDIAGLSNSDISTINRGTDWRVGQLQAEKSGLQRTTHSRITSQSRASSPSKWSLGLGIAKAGLDSYSGYSARKGTT